MAFIPLHIRTSYSFLKSGILLKNLFNVAKKYGYEEIGICDLNVMYSYPEFNNLAKENNIKPIFGLDIEVEDFYLSLILKNENGYRNLCKIVSLISKNKYNDKEIVLDELKDYFKDVICIIPTNKNACFNQINDNLLPIIKKISSYFDDFYIGLEIYNDNSVPHANLIRNFVDKNKLNIVAFPFVSYINKEDAKVIDVLDAIRENRSIDRNFESSYPYFYLKSKDEISHFYNEEEINTTSSIYKMINFDFDNKRGKLIHYLKDFSDEETRDFFINKINDGVAKLNIDLNNKIYKNRLNQEYSVIKKMGFINYFLVVQDYINFAKNNNIPVGPGRGSAAGSLISYALGITDVDPIKYNLLFERFLNIKRNSMPDIDIDISDIKREDVIEYLINKYGYNHVARVSAFQTIAAKQAIRDTGRVYGIEQTIVNEVSKAIPDNFKDENTKNFSLDYAYENIPALKNLIDSDEEYQFLFKEAHRIEGLPRQRGLHAAGVILNENDLLSVIPCDYESETGLVVEFEKDYLEKQGFLKMDLLGLSNLTVIEKCLQNIEKDCKTQIKMEDIPYDTPEIFTLLSELKTMGIFQLDTSASLNALINIRPNCFLDVVATISLDRPGPMQFIPNYSRRKEGKERITYISKDLEPILKETYGIIVYQEQIMQIAQVFSGFTFTDADIFRKAISKKDRNVLLEMKNKFIKGALNKNHTIQEAETLFSQILKFANYGFNKAHAVSYAMIACKEAYLKVNYPIQFYSAILDQQYGANDVKFSKYISEIRKSNIKILLPDINYSSISFTSHNGGLLMPLYGISGLQSKIIINILKERNQNGLYSSFIDFVTRMIRTKEKFNESQLSKLIDAGVFDNLYQNRKALKMSIPSAIQYASSCLFNEGKLINDFGLEFRIPECIDDPIERIENEQSALGVMISDSPLNHINIKDLNEKITPIDSLQVKKTSTIVGIVRSIKQIVVKNGKDKGKPMAFVSLFDESGEIDCTFFTNERKDHSITTKINSILIIKGYLEIRNNRNSFIVNECKEMEN